MIDNKTMFLLSYGLFVLTTHENGFDNGCIINTVMQITDTPNQIVIAVNKNNKTHDMIVSTGKFNLSTISEMADFSLFERFGFKSGRDTDKFSGFSGFERSSNKILYILENTNSFISGEVVSQIDCGTHSMFVAKVKEAMTLNDDKSATYAYYFENIKPKPKLSDSTKKKFVCSICGYVYEGESLPKDFICPLCKHGVEVFEELK